MIAEAWSVALVGSKLALARPGLAVADDGIEGREQLAHDGDESEAPRFAGLAQSLVEAFQRRIVSDRHQAGHVKRGANFDTAALDVSLAAEASSVAVHRRDAGQGGVLVTIDGAEFGQLDQQGASDDVADAGNVLEQILPGTEQRARQARPATPTEQRTDRGKNG